MNIPYSRPSYKDYNGGGILTRRYSVMTNIIGAEAETHDIKLKKSGQLQLEDGFTWDYGTGAIDTKAVRYASLMHDALTDLIRQGELHRSYRKAIDKEYLRFLKEAGMWFPRRMWQYHWIRFYVKFIKPLFG
jgi:hypothetical protein